MSDGGSPPSGEVRTTAYRWDYLSTVVCLVVVITYSALLLGSRFGLTTSPVDPGTWAAYTLAFMAAVAYGVGVDALKAAQEARK